MQNKYKTILTLLAIFILAFGLRINMFSQPGFFEPDNFWEMRMVKDVVLTGNVQTPDDLSYYQIDPLPPQQENFLWNMCAGIYHVTIGWWAGFNEELFTKEMAILPAIFGALTCLVLFFIGRTVSNQNNTVGYITMFVAAVTPGLLYRQMVGSQFTNSFGFLAISLGLLFLMWAFNENKISIKSIVYAIISGSCFLFSVMTWRFYLIIPLLLIAFWAYRTIISLTENKDINKIRTDILHFIIIFSLFVAGCVIKQFNWIDILASFMHIPAIIMYIIIILVIFASSILMYFAHTLNDDWKRGIKSIITIVFIVIVIGIFYFTTLGIDLQDRTSTGGMVGEQSLGNQFFLQKYNIFNLLIPLGFIGMVILFIWKGNKYQYAPMIFTGFLITFIMGWLTLKFCYNLGYGLSFAAIIISILVYELYQHMKDNNKLEMKLIFIPALFILLMGAAAAGIFVEDYSTQLTSDPALQGVIDYFNTQTPEGTHILNNWGQGHILTYTTGRAVSADNRNYSALANKQFAEFENNSDTDYVYNMVLEMDVDYILISLNDFKAMRSNEFYIHNKVDASLGTEFTLPFINTIQCVRDGDILNCSNAGQVDISKTSLWTDTPFNFYNGQYPLYLYAVGDHIIVLNQAANNTNLAKVLSNHPDTVGKYENVFMLGNYVILKVIK